MRKVLCVGIACILIVVMGVFAFASDNEAASLGELSDTELLELLVLHDIEIPSLYENSIDCIPFVRVVIERIETDADAEILYENYALMKFARNIEGFVYNYYGVSEIEPYLNSTNNIIEDSVVYGEWNNEYTDYNSYGYAIGINEWILPGISEWLAQGEPAETYHCNGYAQIANIANWVRDDLEYYGNVVNSVSAVMPTVSAGGHTQVIAIRKDMDERYVLNSMGRWEYNHEIHVMRLGEDGSWYHKPMGTNPLRYKYTPTNSREWVYEGYDGSIDEFFRVEDFTFESEIYYIQYTTPHKWNYAYYGPGQHIVRCAICDIEALGECVAGVPEYLGLSSHQASCTLCEAAFPAEICTKMYVQSTDGAGNYLHQQMCEVCKHFYTPLQSCTFAYTDNGDGTHTAVCEVCDASYEMDCTYTCNYSGSGSTHTTTCTDCDYSVTEACTFVCRYAGRVNGKNTHINVCSSCGYSAFGATQCMYNSSGVCRFCKTPESYSPINRGKEEILTE